jgi:tetratricopeptide (TPR) repeat protein
VLAPRLDTLPEEHKALLCDAAIFGESFWGSGVATLAGREATVVDGIMSCLTQRQLVRPVVSSSLEGESEYLFWHALTRDVAYGELPRRVRVDKHIGAADWLEGRAADRVDEFAGVLAHHYLTAHDLAQDLRRPEQAAAVAPRAGHYLWRAVCRKRASGSGENDNRTQLERALELLPPDAVQRPHVLFMLGESVSWDRPSDAIAYYQEALPGLRARGPANAAAGCAVQLAECLGACGMEGGPALVEESSRLIDERDLSPDLVYALQELAAARLVLLPVSDSAKSVDMADRALRAADRFGMPPPPGALGWRGGARCYLGDAGGLDDFVSAIEQARTQGNGPHLVLLTHNYGCTLRPWKGPATALASFRSARAMAGERDMEMVVLSSKAYEIGCLAALGEWDSALEQARALLPALRASNSLEGVAQVEAAQATILCARGSAHEATELADRLSEAARAGSIQPEVVALAYAAAALVRGATGRREEALELLHECLTAGGWLENAEPEMVRTALTCGERALAERLRGLLARESPLHRHALAATSGLLAEADGALEAAAGDYATAVAGWHEYGWVYEEGMALLGQGRCLKRLGQESVAASVLRQAGRIFERLQARPSLRVARSLLRQAGAEQAES